MAADSVLILLFIIILAIIFIVLSYSGHSSLPQWSPSAVKIGAHRSKLEERVVKILEDITHESFHQAHPSWLKDASGTILELDGYNPRLKVALEVQGPGHIKPLPGESYEKYRTRVARDLLKQKICAEHGVYLITTDYRISLTNMSAYLRSRLFDANIIHERPPNYIKKLDMIPWELGK